MFMLFIGILFIVGLAILAGLSINHMDKTTEFHEDSNDSTDDYITDDSEVLDCCYDIDDNQDHFECNCDDD